MHIQIIGTYALYISVIIYMVVYLPQAIYNQVKHKTRYISLITHSSMVVANSLNIVYAIGFEFHWLFIMVDCIILTFLFIQQLQIWNDNRSSFIKKHTLVVCVWLFIIIHIAINDSISKKVLLVIGYVSNILYCAYWLPQIYKNSKFKKSSGFSIVFLVMILFISILDGTASICLGLPLPSKLGPIIIFGLVLVLVGQYFKFKGS